MRVPESMLLLKEAGEIEKTTFWQRYLGELEAQRWTARKACWQKGDKEYEKGMVEAFNIVLGYLDRPSAFQVLKDSIVTKAGVAG